MEMTISLDKSLTLVRRELKLGVTNEVVSWFSYTPDLVEPTELEAQAKKLIIKVLKEKYEKFENWSGEWCHLPLPSLKFVNRGFPFIEFRIDLYLAAKLNIELSFSEAEELELIKPLKEAVEKFRVPVVLLGALADGDLMKLSQFKVLERDRLYITLDIPGFGEVRLKDSLISSFRRFFKGKKVGQALAESGLLPQDAGNLIDAPLKPGLELPTTPTGSYEDLVEVLKNLGWTKTKAEEVARFAMANYAERSFEDKIKLALQYSSPQFS
jgi:hypothetical protein